MPHPRALLGLTLLLLVAALVGDASRPPPRVVPASAPDTSFSAERAMGHVREIARRPHPPGSAEHARVRGYLLNQIRALGLQPQIQETTAFSRGGSVAAKIYNVLARLPGSGDSGRAVLLAAHYDGVGGSPAASDDASGVAVLLETLRALRAGPLLEHDVVVLITDGEEVGLLGAGAFVRDHPWARDVEVILNFEARGTRGRSIMFESSPGNLDVVKVLRTYGGSETSSIWTPIYRSLPNDTDLSRLADLGKPALNFAFVDGLERYHSGQDDISHLDVRSVQHHGSQALHLATAFGMGPLPRPATGDAVFFPIPGVGLALHPEEWNRGFAVVLLGLLLAAAVATRRAERRWLRGVLVGATGTLAGGLLGVIAVLPLVMLAPSDAGVVGWRGAYAAAIAMASLGVAGVTWGVARRWAGGQSAWLGALVIWSLLSLLAMRYAAGAAFFFLWPALGVAGAAISHAASPGSHTARLLSALSVLVALTVVVPVLYLVGVVGLGLETGGLIIALVTPLLAWLLAPQLGVLVGIRIREFLFATAGGALAIALVTALAPRSPEAMPTKSALAYALDGDGKQAWLLSPAFLAPADSWAREALARVAGRALPDTVSRYSREATVPSEMSSVQSAPPPEWTSNAFGRPYSQQASALAAVELPGATVEFEADSSGHAGRILSLRLRTPAETLLLDIRLSGVAVLEVAVDGHRVVSMGGDAPRTLWTLGYAAPPPEGVSLELVLGPGAGVLELLTRSAGLPPAVASVLPLRPPGTVPGLTGDVTVVRRTFGL